MAFASGQTVTAAMLNRITPAALQSVMSADDTITAVEADLSGLSKSVTTTQANTVLEIVASLDVQVSGSSDFLAVRCYVNGALQTKELNRNTAGRWPCAATWVVPVAAASTFSVKLTGRKLVSGNTTTIFGTHSTMKISGNGIS
jgi:hypothetical protein